MARIVCVGHTTFDTIFLLSEGHVQQQNQSFELCLPFPTKIAVDRRFLSVGGNAPNVAAGLKVTGHGVRLVSQAGEDEIGQIIYAQLKENGFDLTYTARNGESNSAVILSYGQDRTILSYHAEPNYRFPKEIEDVDWIYLTSLGYKLFEPFHHDLMTWLHNHPEVGLVYNPGRVEIAAGFNKLHDVLVRCHTLIVNKEEAGQLLQPYAENTQDLFNEQWLLSSFIGHEIKRVIITDGKKGAYFSDGVGRYFHIAPFSSKVVDTTGAGDAFSGGYLSGVAHGRSSLDALRLASVQSGHAVETPGATTDLLTLKQLDEILSTNPELVPVSLAND